MASLYPYPSEVNVEKFVTVKLSKTNYFTWKTPMLHLIKEHGLEGFINGHSPEPKKKNQKYQEWKRSDELLRKWILHTLSCDDDIHTHVKGSETAKKMWAELEEYYYKINGSYYPYPSEVNVVEFVTVKLSKTNYFTWEKPMRRLIERHGLEGFIDGHRPEPTEKNPKYQDWKRSDELLRKWIFDTLCTDDDIHTLVEPLKTDKAPVKQVWKMLEEQNKELGKDQSRYLPLIKAILDGDCEKTHKFLDQDPNAIRTPVTYFASTPLLVAAESGWRNDLDLVRELVGRMSEDDLAHADRSGCTALHVAARDGNTEVAKLLVKKNPQLPYVLNDDEELPLHLAASNGHKDMVVYLLGVTKKDKEPKTFKDKLGTKLVNDLITGKFYGIALFVVQHHPELACGDPSPLAVLAKMPSAFLSGAHLNFLQHLIYSRVPKHEENIESYFTNREGNESATPTVPGENYDNHSTARVDIESANSSAPHDPVHVGNFENHSTDKGDIESANNFVPIRHIKIMREKKLNHYQSKKLVRVLCLEIVKLEFPKKFSKIGVPLRIAAEDGVHEVVEEIFYSFPNAIYSGYSSGKTVFHYAIKNRRENVFNLLYQIGERYNKLLSDVDKSGNNCLHLAGYLESEDNFNLRASAAGAALQMQRELRWFKAVKKLVQIQDKGKKNKDEKTPAMVFTETHLDLVKEGEKWMKDTANSCIIVATLVVTIMFAAAITVPGGNNGDTGLPFFATKTAFIVFAISDALALFSSTSSVLMFLSILTSRYAEYDFLYTLPRRLIIGLGTLFFSILFMMIAFAATLEILFGDKYPRILIPVASFACIPVILFVSSQFPLLVVMIKSTCCPGIFGKKRDRLFSQESIDTS